ncbi:uncharacterized protein SCHCODRAFT_01090749 [Schizophyllum commune H4-8]|nr:uncharacterized protein SCHCODRAFT_01090749 [Schizophyllum commune H4-8]KAI5896187.1 hypothetical protein SCHCODRAFT_01090749 [Schizophyllum commune H4-8]
MSGSRRTPRRIGAARIEAAPYHRKKASSSFSVTTRARSYVSAPPPTSVLDGQSRTLAEVGLEAHNSRLVEASSEVVTEEEKQRSAVAPDFHASLPRAGSSNESNDTSRMSQQNTADEVQSYKDALADTLAEVEALKAELHCIKESKDLVMSCTVCFTAESTPRVLGCGHTLCESCLTAMYHAKPSKSFLACPICDERISTTRTPVLCYQLRDAWALSNGVSTSEEDVQFVWPPRAQ